MKNGRGVLYRAIVTCGSMPEEMCRAINKNVSGGAECVSPQQRGDSTEPAHLSSVTEAGVDAGNADVHSREEIKQERADQKSDEEGTKSGQGSDHAVEESYTLSLYSDCEVKEEVASKLYPGHVITEELVIGPEVLLQTVVPGQDTSTHSSAVRSCPQGNQQLSSHASGTQLHCAGVEREKHATSPAGGRKYICDTKSYKSGPGAVGHLCTPSVPTIDMECCSTDYLLHCKTSFPKLSFKNKKHVIQLGRARPNMTINYKRAGSIRRFRTIYYDKYTWMTGSCKLNKMFCFPCLLFSYSNSVWSSSGNTDMSNLTTSAKKHIQNEEHLRSCLLLHEFGNSRIETFLANNFEVHNRKVDRNRELMKRFIDTVILLGKQELPFCGHNKSSESDNCGNYVETLKYLCKYDTVLDLHLEQSSSSQNSVFSGLSSDIQNDLLHCIASSMRDEIKSEICKAKFVAAMIDETPDVRHREQLTATIRYLSSSGIEERFLGFCDVSGSRNADVLSTKLLQILDEYCCKHKLISQSYDGAAVMCGEHGGVQAKIRETCPMAVFIPCYTHILNLVLSRSLQFVPELKAFFGHIYSIVRFFNKSTKRTNLLKEIANRRLPGVADTRWHYHSRIINVIFNCRTDMIQTLNTILDSPESWDSESVSMSECLLQQLDDMKFCFLLRVFSDIFEKTDILSALLQSKQVDIAVAKREIDSFERWISEEFLASFKTIFHSIEQICEPPRRRRRMNTNTDIKTAYYRIFTTIIEKIKVEITQRYTSFSQLAFIDLLNKLKYQQYKNLFPVKKLSSLMTDFTGIFDFNALKNELKVLFTSAPLNKLDSYELYLQLQKNSSLSDAFPQVFTLCSLIVTLPISVASAERSFSALKRIHTYVQNSQKEQRLSDLALLSIEKHLLIKIKNNPNFYNNVLAHFVKKNRGIELEYK